jgi:hypothetical protein
MNTYQTTKQKLTKQPNENLPNNQIKTCQTTKLLLNSLFVSNLPGDRYLAAIGAWLLLPFCQGDRYLAAISARLLLPGTCPPGNWQIFLHKKLD